MCWCNPGWRWVLLVMMTLGAAAAEPKRVLVVQSFGHGLTPFAIGSDSFRSALDEAMGKRVDVDEVSMEMARYTRTNQEETFLEDAFVGFLEKRIANWKPDLVVTIGSPAGRFVAKNRDRIFPQTPVLYSSMDRRILLSLDALKTNAACVGTALDTAGFAEDLLQLAPDTTNLVFVIGASALERYWMDAFRSGFAAFTNRMQLTFLNNLSFEAMEKQVAHLPPHSFIFLVLMIQDVDGVMLSEDEMLRRLHTAANAPINSVWRNQLGAGIVGGRLYDAEAVGVQSARVAVRILNGEPASGIPPWVGSAGRPQYDWRELQRWHIPASRLPADSVILFRQPTFWQQYQGRVIASLSVFLVALLLILGLTVNLIRRRQVEAALRESEDQYRTLSRRLIHTQEEERARLARELHDDVTQRLALLAIDVARVERGTSGAPPGETLREVGQGLVRLSGDVQSLSYRLHSSVLEDLGLAEAIKAECDRVARQAGIPVEVQLRDLAGPVPRDVALCLFRVAQEALRNVARHAKARAVEVSLRALDGGLQVSVRDDGVGFNPAQNREHPSLGLASMRERVHLLAGEFTVESAPGGGTRVLAWVPLKGEKS